MHDPRAALLDRVPSLVICVEADGRVGYANAAAVRRLGSSSSSPVGLPIGSLAPELLGSVWAVFIATLRATGKTMVETRLRSVDGESFPAEVTAELLTSGGVELCALFARDLRSAQVLVAPTSSSVDTRTATEEAAKEIAPDATEPRDEEQHRLRQAEKMEAIGLLAGGIAHDFNNQLTAIMGWTDVLSHEHAGIPSLIDCTDRIMLAVRRASDLTSQLLAYSRKGHDAAKPTDLHALVEEVVAILRRSLDKRIAIEVDLEAEAPRTIGDPTEIGNALLNLALNARDAMPDGGTLRFATDLVVIDAATAAAFSADIEPGTFVELIVSDSGTGMDAGTQQHMFEPFFTTKAAGRGTGMGLAAVYGMVKHTRGTIAITSGLGRGTSVRICLPLTQLPLDETHALPLLTALPIVPPRVMLVDDEELVRDTMARLLRQLDCEVVSFGNGADAVDHYRANGHAIDIVVLDLVMPVLDGKSTYFALRRINPNVRVILVSGYGIEGEAQSLLDAGVAEFLPKPFRLAALIEALVRASRVPELAVRT